MNGPIVRPNGYRTDRHFDMVLVALGYEARSSHLVRSGVLHGDRQHAFGFDAHQVLSFDENQEVLRASGFDIHVAGDPEFMAVVEEVVTFAVEASDTPAFSVAVDISSFSRVRLAYLIEVLVAIEAPIPLEIVLFYTLAEFDPPPSYSVPNRHVGPVTPFFAGWTGDPESVVTTILGLGYEPERALGAVEQVQGGDGAWLFLPKSPIMEYEAEVRQKNELLLGNTSDARVVFYPVLDPFHSFVALESLANRSLRTGGGIIFPFGPKIFTAAALLVGAIHRDVAVWRVSPGDLQPPQERRPSRYVTSLALDVPSASAVAPRTYHPTRGVRQPV